MGLYAELGVCRGQAVCEVILDRVPQDAHGARTDPDGGQFFLLHELVDALARDVQIACDARDAPVFHGDDGGGFCCGRRGGMGNVFHVRRAFLYNLNRSRCGRVCFVGCRRLPAGPGKSMPRGGADGPLRNL